MRKIILLAVTGVIILSMSCLGGMIRDSIVETPINNKMMIHSYPRVGDYAEYRESNNAVYSKYSITGRSGRYFIIRLETGTLITGGIIMSKIIIEMYADRYGNIAKGYYVEGAKRTPLKVAKNGDKAYMNLIPLSYREKRQLNIPRRITVPAGTFNVRSKAFRVRSKEKNSQYEKVVYLTNNRVKFGYVATYTFRKGDSGVFERQGALTLYSQGRN